MDRPDFTIRTKQDLKDAVERLGFLPFFANSLPGLSVEEHTAPELWFSDDEGPWEWKGPVIRESKCAYGKFFEKKAAFISGKWFCDFANFRRDGYDFDVLYDDGKASYRDKELFELLDGEAPVLSKALKRKGNYIKGGKKGFETMITRLQSECYVLISDFVYAKDRYGQEYGWGIAQYSTPEKFMGKSFAETVYKRTPKESYQRILEHLKSLMPDIEQKRIEKFLL